MLGTHPTTFEFTKDKDLTLRGNCIIGVDADFRRSEVRALLGHDMLRIRMDVSGEKDEVLCRPNRGFDDDHEIVVRLGVFDSTRTLGVDADKASKHLNRKMMELMKDPLNVMRVEIEGFNNDGHDDGTMVAGTGRVMMI
jgi:hypothetical protein